MPTSRVYLDFVIVYIDCRMCVNSYSFGFPLERIQPILRRMVTLIFFAWSTLTSRLDEMLLTMFRSEGSASNGDLHSMNDISVSESAVLHVCLACDTSLCCSTKTNETLAVPLNHFLISWYASVRQAVGHYAVGAGMFVCLFWMQRHLTKHVK